MRSSRRSAQRGFTLIEMIVVVAILVILAGFILPKLDRVALKANKGVAAANMGGVSRYIQTYRIMHNVYPDRWDSLVDDTAHALVAPGAPGLAAGIDPQLTGGPPAGSPVKLTTFDLGSLPVDEGVKAVRSLQRMGITTLLDWDPASGALPGNRFLIPRDLTVSIDDAGTPTDTSDDTLDSGVVVAIPNASDEDGEALIDHIYPENKLPGGTPGAIPAGKMLVVFGFGPLNQAIGDVLQESPTYANTDATQYYNRNLAIFEISTGGSRCELKAVVGGDADRIDEEVADYYEK